MKKLAAPKRQTSKTERRTSLVAQIAQNRAKTLLVDRQHAFCSCFWDW